ncbi:hypothetical protein P153DRAFT_288018 [Dothidotthia symphoricarpi CBS 119687]|uniref:DUF1531-domain-containing protein n=1 Tax=Dothidotthia symphoricarpi CBS 119687 TaxID=1392245 RepID=A0A6A6AI35_9PLEO|nr:uncharacterized protein P153DRAFT_288018 [Dothidotthia symphoricarpi CBS 119687]KAF2130913.1 hypothetical protein P153DRAFT_288018 [Dothidotthia symphoricarpi CBS 119687]
MEAFLEEATVWKDRLLVNSRKSIEQMSAQRWIRIILIIGAYMLVRPYLLKGAENRQKKIRQREAEELGLDAGVSANTFRGARKPAGKGQGQGKVLGEVDGEGSGDKATKRK